MKKGSSGKAVHRKDYSPYPWVLERVVLRFEIGEESTRVHSTLAVERRTPGDASADLVLDGQGLSLRSVALDGRELGEAEFSRDDDTLVIHEAPDRCRIEIEVEIRPHENTALEGLYASGEFLLTQCEAEGFRKITYFPDRPDVMTRYEVTLVADKRRHPVLLSNGNAVASGELGDGRHWVTWDDPFAKPSYLFALVAGDLACVEDRFRTRSGRDVALRVYVEHENAGKCDHAMESLIKSMKWDEERFDLEYDLDVYHIVATDHFNMGAMENKSLNIFNSKYVLARPDSATDTDYQGIEGVIAHEYFHNWTGNRVTCRDWFQLTLKEGLTVFRDQEFSSDQHSRAVKRIQDVRVLRSRQFPEDSGPMAHPIRPDAYQEINNFYTMTVYQKGAEIIRMIHTLLGETGFQKGMKLYFERHDGEAVTCDDFRAAMADANGIGLERFGRWYGQSGTPVLKASGDWNASDRTYSLTLSQHTPATHDQPEKRPLVIPVAMGLLTRDGTGLPLRLSGEGKAAGTSRVLLLEDAEQTFVFEDVPEEPVPSLLRGYSAPVKLDCEYTNADLALLMARDSDAFVRWEAAQLLAQSAILENVDRHANGVGMTVEADLVEAFRLLLGDTVADTALVAEAMILPGEDYLAEQMPVVDVDGIHAARRYVKSTLAQALEPALRARYEALGDDTPYSKAPEAMAKRSLRNVCLSYLMETEGGADLASRQLAFSDNMTDTLAALQGLAWTRSEEAGPALAEFESRWRDDPLVMDKWFTIQATVPGADTVGLVHALLAHDAFSLKNPNKVRSLLGAFAFSNPTAFHAGDGSGYRLFADQVIALDALNPQVAARMVGAFNSWTRYDPARKAKMKAELGRIASVDGLSPDVTEIVGNAMGMVAGEAAA
ncbi:MAG: aminopeptidase N [Gammaproteobacteria bacterium]|nr:aminopeptidase N [Gammaproteobacteria bacterium]